jgi:PAS domain-containing protein
MAGASLARRKMFGKKKKLSAEALTALAENISQERDRISLLRKLTEQLKTERSLLFTVLQHLPCGVVIAKAPGGDLVMGNELIEQIWRLPLRKLGTQHYRGWEAFHPDGRPYEAQDWPLARAIEYGEEVLGEVSVIRRGDGTYGYVMSNATPLRDHKGQIIAGMLAVMEIPSPEKNKFSFSARKLAILTPRAA